MAFVLGVKIYDNSLESAVKTVIEKSINSKERKSLLISATSAHGIVISKIDKNFFNVLSNFYMNLPDGVPVVWVEKMKGYSKAERCSGPEFFEKVMIESRDTKIKHFLCGGKEGVAEELMEICEKKFGNKNVVGTFSPPFREMTEDELKYLAEKINSLGTNIVWIGLSTPKQEIFAFRLSKYVNVNFICTIGAAFDFHTGRLKRAPKFMQNIGLEWLYRLIMEPKRLWKRYFMVVPLFIYYNILEFFNGKFFQKK